LLGAALHHDGRHFIAISPDSLSVCAGTDMPAPVAVQVLAVGV
jgi:hypothetical protein